MKFHGNWALEANGIWIRGRNLITTQGRTSFSGRIAADTLSMPSHVAFGSGTNTPALANTALQAEQYAFDIKNTSPGILGTRITADSRIFEVFLDTNAQITYGGASFVAKEAGIFGRQAGKTAVCYARFLMQDVSFSNGFKWRLVWTMPFEEKEG